MDIMASFFATIDFVLSAISLYRGLENMTANPSLNFSISLFCFGMGILQVGLMRAKDMRGINESKTL